MRVVYIRILKNVSRIIFYWISKLDSSDLQSYFLCPMKVCVYVINSQEAELFLDRDGFLLVPCT